MLFPESLQYYDERSLLSFIFDSDAAYQNKRSIFMNGNIIKKNTSYSRAHQAELSFIAKQLKHTSCFEDMLQLLSHSFSELNLNRLDKIVDIDADNFPSDFQAALITCKKKNEHYNDEVP